MKTLIIPDIHHKTRQVATLLNRVSYDEVISLGDWFDDFGDTPQDAERTAGFLKDFLSDARHLTLIGNHDLPYITWDVQDFCSGFTSDKAYRIRSTIPKDLWNTWIQNKRVSLYQFRSPYYLVHAGFDEYWGESPLSGKEMPYLLEGSKHPRPQWLGAGKDRGGPLPVGGPLWVDFRVLRPASLLGDCSIPLVQIVGHTQGRHIRQLSTKGFNTYCLDTTLRHYGILEDEVLQIFHWNGEPLDHQEIVHLSVLPG